MLRTAVVLACSLLAATPTTDARQSVYRTNEEVLAAFDAMPPREQRGVADYLRLDLSGVDLFQIQLTQYALSTSDRAVGYWPDAPEIQWFDPKEYAPAQPIKRKVLDPDSRVARAFLDQVERTMAVRRLVPGYRYDWASGDIVRLPRADDPRRVVENALQGFNPDLDLAEALVLRFLDDGTYRETITAFEHRYTDRSGNVWPNLSLYDAWSSGAEMEMPDVDVLGLARTLIPKRDFRKSWKAPIANSDHPKLYGTLEELFVPAKQYRSLREALARCYLIAQPAMRDGFGPGNIDVFHAFWEVHGSAIDKAGAELPDPGKRWTKFLSDWLKKLGKDDDLVNQMRVRSGTLASNEEYIRRRLIAVMDDMGAFGEE